ncbi:uncharacterized protein PG986_000696 [Apiospora aurea]|uniref:Uncharacterized protein n=1 Tax=Apiospora aurea TaxID=335848 RepID=A0ABR1QV02_9PEZI
MVSIYSTAFLLFSCIIGKVVALIATPKTVPSAVLEAACERQCTLIANWFGAVDGWWDLASQLDFPANEVVAGPASVHVTATIITVINTISNTTSLETKMPIDWIPPPTNAAGTQVRVVTDSLERTTTMAFPTSFGHFGDSYTKLEWCGNSTTSSVVTFIPPQFRLGNEFDFSNATYGSAANLSDPRGLLANPAYAAGPGLWLMGLMPSLFPPLPTESCDTFFGGPVWGGFLTAWATVTSTAYS